MPLGGEGSAGKLGMKEATFCESCGRCPGVVLSFLGGEAREIFRLYRVARTYQYGVESAAEAWRRSLLPDASHTCIQGAPVEDFDLDDNSDIDRIPHRFPEDDGAGVGIAQQVLFHNSDDSNSEDSGTPTA